MLSALISSELSYPAMQLALQPVHQRFVHSGPLVLGAAPVKLPTPTADRDQTVSRRFKPSSRTTLNGEQPYPWDLLQPQDVMSRHRGAKHRRRYELLGGISLLSPEYLLSVERWPFHAEPPDHYDRTFVPARLVCLAVKLAYTIALTSRCPTVISKPSCSSVTLWEETAPVKLPTRHCPRPRFAIFVRTSNVKGWYFKDDSIITGVTTSKSPTYPTHQNSMFSVKL